MKRIALALAGLLIVAVAMAIARRLSSEAMAVIVGIVMGIGASIPTCILMLYLLSRQDEAEEQRAAQLQKPAPASQAGGRVYFYNYGTLIVGPDARVAQIGPPREWQPEQWRALPADEPVRLLLPGGER